MAYGLALPVLKIAKRYGGRAYVAGLFLAWEAPQVFKEQLKELQNFKVEVKPDSLMNPGKLEGESGLNSLMRLAYSFELIVRLLGNASKVSLTGRFKERRGIPGDVAWYAYACAQCGYCVNTCDQYYGRGWESQSPCGKWYWLKEYLKKGGRARPSSSQPLFGLHDL